MEESPPDLDVSLGVKDEQKAETQAQEKPEDNGAPVAQETALDDPPAENKAEVNVEDKSVT